MDFKNKIARFKEIMKDFDKLEKSVQSKLMGVADRLAPGVQGGMIAPKEVQIPEPTEYPDIKETVIGMNVRKHQLEKFAEQFLKSDWHPNFEKAKAADSGYGLKDMGSSGVHHQSAQGSIGTSTAGHRLRTGNKYGPDMGSSKQVAHGDAKTIHREKLQELRSMPKPNLGKTQKNPSTTVPFEEKPTHREYIAPTHNVTGSLKADRDAHNAKSPGVPPALHASGAMAKAQMHGTRPAMAPIKAPEKNPKEVQPPAMGKNWAYNWSR